MNKINTLHLQLSAKCDSDLASMLTTFGYYGENLVSRETKINALVGLVSQYTFCEDYAASNTAIKILIRAEKVLVSRKIFPKLV